MPDTPPEQSKTWKDRGAEWLFQQGTSTVLLVALLGYIGYATYTLVPKHIEAIKSGYKDQSDSHERTMEKVVESHDKDREAWNQDRKSWLELMLRQRNASVPAGAEDNGT